LFDLEADPGEAVNVIERPEHRDLAAELKRRALDGTVELVRFFVCPDCGDPMPDSYVKRLREKLGPARELLETVRGVGYRLLDPADGA